MRYVCAVLAVSVAGCFGPVLNGEVACEDGLCPPGLACFDGVCLRDPPVVAPDAMEPDATPLCLGFEPNHFDACALPDPGPALDLDAGGTYRLDTTDGTLTDPDDNPIDLVSVEIDGMRIVSIADFQLASGNRLRATGSFPLVIASFDGIDIAGVIDVDDNGAGANVDCETLAPERGTNNPIGASGGGGGGFGSAGGDGGDSAVTEGAAGGQALTEPPTEVRGGCEGGEGGDGDPQSDGEGGDSGGAVLLAARNSITVTGTIDACGEGGFGGELANGGAGGGGSGGYIGLDAPSIDLNGASLGANGGGGGEGADQVNPGDNGSDGNPTINGASGGAGMAVGGTDGGDGGSGTSPGASVLGSDTGAGGGGGGGVGFILTRGAVTESNATISPPARPMPAP